MKKCTMIMYFVQKQAATSPEQSPDHPNAFIISTAKTVTPRMIRDHFPWERLGKDCPKCMRFGIKSGNSTFWLDLQDNEEVPLYGKDSVLVKLSREA